ncbi:hypothetical protein EF849_06850 [Aeromonas jandaei]|nr:hypothetical protein [Aeromonas jandaei]
MSIRAVPIWRHLVIAAAADKARGMRVRQPVTRSKNSHYKKVSDFGDSAVKMTILGIMKRK